MELKDLTRLTRTRRRFDKEHTIKRQTLLELVDLARLSASGANLQPLKYILCCDAETNAQVFPLLGWAAYLRDWPGPEEGERPTAYIVVLGDTTISKKFGVDPGIAMQSILLGATEKGLGGCIIATIHKEGLRDILLIPDDMEVLYVIALGKPTEKVVIEPVGEDGDIKYWHDRDNVHHVPKRSLDEIILK
jgi:nitroreductase